MSDPIISQIWDLVNSALSRNNGEEALRALRSIKAANVTLVPDAKKKSLPGMRPSATGVGRRFRSQYDGRCKLCDTKYSAGDEIYWVKNDQGSKCFCLDCANESGLIS